jgi:transcription initiation factor TFIID subunit 1
MYRAPIFKHNTKSTDFLVIRSSTGVSGTTWHVRNVDNLFVVGQQFPSMEIPGPHSRRVTNAAKNRMKMIAYRQIRHSTNKNLKIGDVTAHITDSTDMQNRQKLKEFISYDKVEKVWRMKPGEQVPEEVTIRSMVKPEDVCIIDAMQVGSRQLQDAGYDLSKYDENDADDEGKGLEEQLTPWFSTKAFLDASSGKAMLQLHGAGDPTGCGLGFSYIKISMKGGYIGAIQGPNATSEAAIEAERKANGGHTYNVRKQEAAYNDAIREIWDKQKANLTDPTERAENEMEREQAAEDERLGIGQAPHSIATPAAFDDSASQFSTDSHSGGKAMRITRTIRNKFGDEEETAEIVKDPRVWREYQKRRHAIDAEHMK